MAVWEQYPVAPQSASTWQLDATQMLSYMPSPPLCPSQLHTLLGSGQSESVVHVLKSHTPAVHVPWSSSPKPSPSTQFALVVHASAGVDGEHGVSWARWLTGGVERRQVAPLLDVVLLLLELLLPFELLLLDVELVLTAEDDVPPPAPPPDELEPVPLDVVPPDTLTTVPPQCAAPITASKADPASCTRSLIMEKSYHCPMELRRSGGSSVQGRMGHGGRIDRGASLARGKTMGRRRTEARREKLAGRSSAGPAVVSLDAVETLIARSRKARGRGERRHALVLLRQACALDEWRARSWTLLGALLAGEGAGEEAAQALNRARWLRTRAGDAPRACATERLAARLLAAAA